MEKYLSIDYLSKNFEKIVDTITTNSMKLLIGLLVLLIGFKVIKKTINRIISFINRI